MFPLFLQLPRDIRRMIWLATLSPMTLTFGTGKPPKDEEESEDLTDIDLSLLTKEQVDYLLRRPLFANYTRYYGYVALADGSSRLSFTIKSSAAYLACKESRAFLRFIFAEPVRPGGGLPSWFRFDIDTVRFLDIDVGIIANYPWFTQVQYLIVHIVYEIYDYMGIYSDTLEERNGKNHIWVEENLTSLKHITFEIGHAYTYTTPKSRPYHWLEPWWDFFEKWYNCEYGSDPAPFFAQVISYNVPEEEWLTPTNYLRVRKLVLQKRVQSIYERDEVEDFDLERDWQGRKIYYILKAKDEELENAAEFLKKQRPIWRD